MTQEHMRTKEKEHDVRTMASCGVPQEIISKKLGIDVKTLRKHYRDILSHEKANLSIDIMKSLYTKAVVEKDTSAIIWATKTVVGLKDRSRVDPLTPPEDEDGKMPTEITYKWEKSEKKTTSDEEDNNDPL